MIMTRRHNRLLPFLVSAMAVGATAVPATAQGAPRRVFHIPAQSLDATLRAIALVGRQNVVAPSELLDGHVAPALDGRYAPTEAVRLVLLGSGLHAQWVGTSLIIRAGEAEQHEAPDGQTDIVVTGTRIRGSGPVGSSVVVIDRKAIEASGYGTTQQIVRSLPQNFNGGPSDATANIIASGGTGAGLNTTSGAAVNLRGLGASSTLLLLNGNRPPLGGFSGVFGDLSLVPVSAVDRIEVLGDGASAIYGSDAVAGVVNVITRDRFVGFEATARFATADGDSQEEQASVIYGRKWNSGHFVLSYEYDKRGRLAADDRAYATEDLRAFGGSDHRSEFAAPGTIIAGDGSTYAIPTGQNGTGLNPALLVAGTVNRGDQWRGADLLPLQERHAVYGSASQDLLPGLTLYGEALFAARRAITRLRETDFSEVTVPTTNPFYVDPIGTHEDVGIEYAFQADLGQETTTAKVTALASLVGLKAQVHSWNFDVHANYGVQVERARTANIVNTARLAVALADTDPATAYNLFGGPHSTPQATIDAVRGSYATNSRYRMWSLTVRADGPLLALPAGDVKLAIGGERRQELFVDRPSPDDTASLKPVLSSVTDLPGERKITAGFAEIFVPMFGSGAQVPLIEKLDLSIAGRIEHYNDFGTTTNPKLGLSWQPVGGLTLRGSYGKSFRAPGINDLRQGRGISLYFSYPLNDPASPTGTTNALVLRGNDPKLRPERATTWTAGFDLRPSFASGLHLTATYFNIDYRDRIGTAAANLLSFLVNRPIYQGIITDAPSAVTVASYYANPVFINPFRIPASAIGVLIDARTTNLSVVKERGIDFDLGWDGPVIGGDGSISLSGTWLASIKQQITATSPAIDVVDTLGSPVDLRMRGAAGWSRNGLAVFAAANFVNSYFDRSNKVVRKIPTYTTFDLSLRYRVPDDNALAGFTLALSATNLFDRDPPFVERTLGATAVGYDPEQADALGRVIAIQLTKAW
jgi:iron complex outermembrane receptor protein